MIGESRSCREAEEHWDRRATAGLLHYFAPAVFVVAEFESSAASPTHNP